jgi:hypothetical protein
MSQFTQKKPDKCAEVLLSHEVQTSVTCSTKWLYHPHGQILKRNNDYACVVSIYCYGGVKNWLYAQFEQACTEIQQLVI